MKRAFWITLLALVAFLGILIARLPASWLIPSHSGSYACGDLDGTVWSGTCSGLLVNGQSLGDLAWEIHSSRLFAGKLNASLGLTRAGANAHGELEVGLDKLVTARHIQADLPLDPAIMPELPANVRGTLHANIALLRLRNRAVEQLQGQIEVHDLVQGSDQFGSYALNFPPTTSRTPIGQLHDLGGPLAIEGSLRLTPEPGYDLEGLIAARATATEDIRRAIEFLGSPDAQGRRLFSLAGTY